VRCNRGPWHAPSPFCGTADSKSVTHGISEVLLIKGLRADATDQKRVKRRLASYLQKVKDLQTNARRVLIGQSSTVNPG
jgi:hypothetical protein